MPQMSPINWMILSITPMVINKIMMTKPQVDKKLSKFSKQYMKNNMKWTW